jgi:fucose 4-O-acetylase-like acetyltransferase
MGLRRNLANGAQILPRFIVVGVANMRADQITLRRVAYLDVAKGIAISLVVFGHVLGGALARNWIIPLNGAELVYNFIYTFHMPFFFMISGALAIDHIRREPLDAFISRCGSIAWPYLLWSAIFVAGQSYLAKFMMFPPADIGTAASIWRVLLGETSWFLWTLFICQVLLLAAAVVPVIAVLSVSLVVALIASRYDLGSFRNVVHFMPYLALGAMIANRIKTPLNSGRSTSIVCSIAIFGLVFTYTVLGLERDELTDFLLGIAGSAALLLFAYAVAFRGFLTRLLSKIGEASLVIFLLHPYMQSAARIVVTEFAGSNLTLQLIVPTLAGILAPFLVWLITEKLGLVWLFRLPISKSGLANARLRRQLEQEQRNCSV